MRFRRAAELPRLKNTSKMKNNQRKMSNYICDDLARIAFRNIFIFTVVPILVRLTYAFEIRYGEFSRICPRGEFTLCFFF